MKHAFIMAILFSFASSVAASAVPESRYFHTGDGRIDISSAKNGAHFKGVYRNSDGTHDQVAMKEIYRIFQARFGDPSSRISPRLIEFFDYLADNLNPGARITVVSGYRSPTYNTKLRDNGKLAAKASLHQYGMAADVKIAGVSSERVWNFIKELGFGGAGFYHGGLVHVDVGPARSWDETTSGVGTDISEDNKLITIVTDKDIYLSGEDVELRFTRMTAFPIGVDPEFKLERVDGKKRLSFRPAFSAPVSGNCPKFSDIVQMSGIKWTLPKDLPSGRYRIRATFCNKEWTDMPEEIETPGFEVKTR